MYTLECQNCHKVFDSKYEKAKWCSDKCGQRGRYKPLRDKSIKTFEETRITLAFTLAVKYGWVCWYCNLPLAPLEHRANVQGRDKRRSIIISRPVSVHIDHIIPKSNGGSDALDNLALTCEFCNRAKLDMSVDAYLSWLDRVRCASTWTPIRDGRKQ